MGLGSTVKTFVILPLISLILYGLVFHALPALHRRHRARYAHYLPVALQTDRPDDIFPNYYARLRNRLLRSSLAEWASGLVFSIGGAAWQRGRYGRVAVDGRDESDDDEGVDGDEELDEAVWDGTDGGVFGGQRGSRHGGERARLSRDLEEGFRDSSDGSDSDSD